MKNIVREYKYRGRNFTIIKKDEYYLAIEDKYITDGKLNKTLNGIQMYASPKLDQCINQVHSQVDVDWYQEQGMTKAEAFAKAFNIPKETAKELFA